MGGAGEKVLFTITGICREAIDKLLDAGYIQSLQFLGGEIVESHYVITDKGRQAFNKILEQIPLEDKEQPIISDEEDS